MLKYRIVIIMILSFLFCQDDISAQHVEVKIPQLVDTFSLYWQEKRKDPIKKDLKIMKIVRKYRDMYFIYASNNDTLYKIVSYIDRDFKIGKKIKVGQSYSIWIQSFEEVRPNGKPVLLSGFLLSYNYCGRTIHKEPGNGIMEVFNSRQLNGIRLLDSDSTDYSKMGICPDLLDRGFHPSQIHQIRHESKGEYGNLPLDTNILVLGLNSAKLTMPPPIIRDVKIESIKRVYKDFYFIYASYNDTTCKILYPCYREISNINEFKKNKTYKLRIQSVYPELVNGKRELPPLSSDYYFDHMLTLEPGETFKNIFTLEEIIK